MRVSFSPGKITLAVSLRMCSFTNGMAMPGAYLLDHVRVRHVFEPLHAWIGRQSCRCVPLRPGRSVEGAPENRRWHVLVNEPIEVEA